MFYVGLDLFKEEAMPKYNLYCKDCDKEHSVWASMADKTDGRIPCPDCGKMDLETVFKAPPAYVKGNAAAQCPNRSGCGSSCPHAG